MTDLPETITVLGRECQYVYRSAAAYVWQSKLFDEHYVEVTKARLWTDAPALPAYEADKLDTISVADPPLDGRCPDLWRVYVVQGGPPYQVAKGTGPTLAEAESNLRRNAHEWAAVLGAL